MTYFTARINDRYNLFVTYPGQEPRLLMWCHWGIRAVDLAVIADTLNARSN